MVIGKMGAAGTRWELSKAAAEFLDLCERYPFVHSLLEHAFPHGFPSPVQRQLLLASSLVGGEPIKASTLQLTIDQIKNACIAALMQNDLIVRNEIIHGLRAALELQELVQPGVTKLEEIIRIIQSQLPSEREEALRIIDQLRNWVEQR